MMQPTGENNQISINPHAVAYALGAVALLLILINVGGQFLKFKGGYNVNSFLPLFDLSLERNIPTYFSVLLMISASILLAVIAILNHKQSSPYILKWGVLSLGFLYMAYDEGLHVHEDLNKVVRPLLGEGRLGIFYNAWVIPAIILVLLLLLFFSKFLIYLSAKTRAYFLVAATIYLSGCIGTEIIGGYYDEIHGMKNLTFNMISAIEESLEMTGLIFFIYALLQYLSENFNDVIFRISFTENSNKKG